MFESGREDGRKRSEGERPGRRFSRDLLALYIRPEVPRAGRYALDLPP